VDYCQSEAGAFITSPIYTGSASVTRATDAQIRVATSVMAYSQSAVTLYGKGTPHFDVSSAASQTLLGTDDATTNERHQIWRELGNPKTRTVDGGSTLANTDSGTWAVSTSGKLAASIVENDLAASFDGGAVATDTALTMPTVHTIGIGNSVSSSVFMGHIAQVMILPRAMTDGELQTLSTP
jgi:hypothetical protein